MRSEQETKTETTLAPPAAASPFLFAELDAEEATKQRKAEGNYTAEELKSEQPLVYNAVLEFLKAGVGLLKIGKAFRIHHRTAAAIRDGNRGAIDIARSKMVTDLRTAAQLQVERLIEHPDLVPYNVAGLVASQLLEKAELLDGRATARVEELERGPDIHDKAAWEKLIRSLPTEKQLDGDHARVIDLDAGGNLPLEGPAAPDSDLLEAAEALLTAAAAGRTRVGTDAESEVRRPIAEGNRSAVTTQATTEPTNAVGDRSAQDRPAARPDVRTGGGGGVDACAEGGLEPIGPITQEILGNEANP